MEISIKSFRVMETGLWSGMEFNCNGNKCYVPFHQGIYQINVNVNLDDKVGSFKFHINLPDWISNNERRSSIEGILMGVEEMNNLDELNKWYKNLKKRINEYFINECNEYK